MTAPAVPVCYRHPGRETYVSCVRCGRPICPDCMNAASVGFQCPECVAEGQRATRPARTTFGGSRVGAAGYVTMTLIALNVLGLVADAATAGIGSLLSGGLFSGLHEIHLWGAVHAGDVYLGPDGQGYDGPVPGGTLLPGVDSGVGVYRLFTSMFIHFGPLHLLLNMWALWVLGRSLEAALGPLRFLGLYLLSGLGGSVAALLFTPDGFGAGASGAIFGLFAALFIVLRKLRRDTSSVLPVIVINLVLTFTIPGISIAAHLGGLVTGALIGVGLAYAPRQARTPVQVTTFVGIGLVLAMLTAVAIVT